jgi:hypothetical protein
MNIEQQLEEVKSRIAEIEKAIKKEAEKPKGIELNTGNYWLYGDGDIDSSRPSQKHRDINNCWLTGQQAVEARNIMSAVFELKQLCDIINEGWKPDFEDDDECKYYLGYDHVGNAFIMSSISVDSSHSFYFKLNCLNEIWPVMSDNLKAYIRGGVVK